MLSERERLTALINNMREWTPGSGAYHLEEEDIPIEDTIPEEVETAAPENTAAPQG